MIKLLKYLRGYLRIRVWGFSPERFMNLCSNKGILLWDIEKQGDVYEMCIHLKGFRALRPIVKKTGTRAAILERYGLPFLLPRLLKRKVFAAGLLLAVAFWIFSARYVWSIELSGNYQITRDVFDDFLESHGIAIGMRRDSLDIEELEKEIRRQFPQVTWASAKLAGTRLVVDIKENDAPIVTEKPQTEGGTDLISEYGGVVVSMIVRSGVPAVSIGDTVEEGTILVGGKVPILNDDGTVREYHYVDADADIILEHTVTCEEHLAFDYVKKVFTGREKKSHYLRLGSRRLQLPGEKPYLVYDSLVRESRPVLFEKLSVPVAFGICTYREYQNVEFRYTKEEAAQVLNEKLIAFLTSLEEKGVQIIEKNVTINTNGGEWVLSGEFLVHGPVGKSAATVKTESGETREDEQ